MYWSLMAIMAMTPLAATEGDLPVLSDTLGRLASVIERFNPAMPRLAPVNDTSLMVGPTVLDPVPRELPSMAQLEDRKDPNWFEGKDGVFGDVQAVDPEDLPLPTDAPSFIEAPRRPGAPPYTALYLGLRIGLPRRAVP